MARRRKIKFGNRGFDNSAKTELQLYIDNDSELYKTKTALIKNYSRRRKKGKFDNEKAVKGVENNLVDKGARKYQKEFGGVKFPRDVRHGVAVAETREIIRGIDSGEYE